jgi:hypothetical protein
MARISRGSFPHDASARISAPMPRAGLVLARLVIAKLAIAK